MATPQWKSFQPSVPARDPAILAYQRPVPGSPPYGNMQSGFSPGGSQKGHIHSPQGHHISPQMMNGHRVNGQPPMREAGFIEKLLHSYGFVQSTDREARLFFHFSEYAGNVEEMKVGDTVEFQQSFDRKTGKPIACAIVKLANPVTALSTALSRSHLDQEDIKEERVTGTVAQEAKSVSKPRQATTLNSDGLGRVTYEQKGECFFLPFSHEDVDGAAKLRTGDAVTFVIAADKRSGTICARSLRHAPVDAAPAGISGPSASAGIQGVVCSMKEAFGFIERADAVKEIFFHYSEYVGNINDLLLGDDVDFSITVRNGKEVAVDVKRLPQGTVIFEDVALDRRRGKVQKTLRNAHGRLNTDPLSGRIVYETLEGPIDIQFGDKDQKGDYTLMSGDMVEFNIATDRRDKLHRATNIALVYDTFKVNGEHRETGLIASLKEGFGFITCLQREARMFFHYSELLDGMDALRVNAQVEFTVVQDPASAARQIAIRLHVLPSGSVLPPTSPSPTGASGENVSPVKVVGTVEKELVTGPEEQPGIMMYDVNGTKQTILYAASAMIGGTPKAGDKVEFQVSESRQQGTRSAVNVRVLSRCSTLRLQGFVATLKDNFGFIETASHDKEIFFHFSAFEGDPSTLDIGDEVEYTTARKNGKNSAENIRKLPKGIVAPEHVKSEVMDGKIMRCMRVVNPDQEEYAGLIQVLNPEGSGEAECYSYGVTSLADKRDFLQMGDVVKFQLATVVSTGAVRATNVSAVRKFIRARVDSVKGQFGFLSYEVEENRKLFFHMTEVHDGASVQPGDEVEFVVVKNQRSKKYSAVSLRKMTQKQRPERLISRLKSSGDDGGPRLVVIRQPRGPDATKGFCFPRHVLHPPGDAM